MNEADEHARIRAVYRQYDSDPKEQAKRDRRNPGLRFIQEEHARATLRALRDSGFPTLAGCRALDVGCGFGRELAALSAATGLSAECCHGVDLLPDRIEAAKSAHPRIDFRVADARELPYPDRYFDLVTANVVLSSILDDLVATAVAREMMRVVRPHGLILIYDNRLPNPLNPNVRGYRARDYRSLFPGSELRLYPNTLLPPIARAIGRRAPRLLSIVPVVGVLRGRYVAAVRPPRPD